MVQRSQSIQDTVSHGDSNPEVLLRVAHPLLDLASSQGSQSGPTILTRSQVSDPKNNQLSQELRRIIWNSNLRGVIQDSEHTGMATRDSGHREHHPGLGHTHAHGIVKSQEQPPEIIIWDSNLGIVNCPASLPLSVPLRQTMHICNNIGLEQCRSRITLA